MATQGRTRWGDREQRRADILAAAWRLLERSGYAQLNMRDVAGGAGVSAGTVYTYFESREELFATLYAERLERFGAELAQLSTSALSLEELFVQVATRYRDVYQVFGRELNVWGLGVSGQGTPPADLKPGGAR